MEIINPHSHPIIKKIKACPGLTDQEKVEAIKDIVEMIIDPAYRKQVTYKTLDEFMKCDNIVLAFTWMESKLGYNTWFDIARKL